jgi:hypothetical protein
MNDVELERATRTTAPHWLVIFLIMATAGITAAALSTTGPPESDVIQDRAPPSAARASTFLERPVLAQPAAISGAPRIIWGTPIGHGDRGPCTNCHLVVSREAEQLPSITAFSSMPHEFRGVCNNCHMLEVSWLLRFLPAAAMPNPAGPNTGLGSLVAGLLGLGSDRE